MKNSEYTDKIRSVGQRLIENYIKTGHVEAGINGPYDDPETEVRNLAHLMVIASIEYLKYGKDEYLPLISRMADEVMAMREPSGIYKMRQKDGKDQCNGVIGHAWLVEGLLYAYKVTKNKGILEEIERIFKMHGFQTKLGLWGRPLMGASNNAIDFTLNHQLWYAATLSEYLSINSNSELCEQLNCFFKQLSHNMLVNDRGRISHSIYRRMGLVPLFKMYVKRFKINIYEKIGKPSLMYKEIGYHVFNLMALARLYKQSPNNLFFKNTKFERTISYIGDKEFQQLLSASNIEQDGTTFGKKITEDEKSINIYGYPYNVTGFELLYCQQVFGAKISKTDVEYLCKRQFELTWSEETHEFGNRCHDKTVINYRVYEYYRYLEV